MTVNAISTSPPFRQVGIVPKARRLRDGSYCDGNPLSSIVFSPPVPATLSSKCLKLTSDVAIQYFCDLEEDVELHEHADDE